jgi:hypothetical protein
MLRLFEDARTKRKQLELHGPRRLFFPSPGWEEQEIASGIPMHHQSDPLEDSSSQRFQEKTRFQKLREVAVDHVSNAWRSQHRGKRSMTHSGAHPDHLFTVPPLARVALLPKKSYHCNPVDPQDAPTHLLLLLRGSASSQWEGLAVLTTQRRDQLAQECVVELAADELGEQQATSTQPKASTVLLTIPP